MNNSCFTCQRIHVYADIRTQEHTVVYGYIYIYIYIYIYRERERVCVCVCVEQLIICLVMKSQDSVLHIQINNKVLNKIFKMLFLKRCTLFHIVSAVSFTLSILQNIYFVPMIIIFFFFILHFTQNCLLWLLTAIATIWRNVFIFLIMIVLSFVSFWWIDASVFKTKNRPLITLFTTPLTYFTTPSLSLSLCIYIYIYIYI